jgi:hypothetical protein
VHQSRDIEMGLFTHHDKLVLFRNRLTEAQTQERREEILRLLAAEEAKEGITAILMGKSKSNDSSPRRASHRRSVKD